MWAVVAAVVILVALSVGRFILALRRDKQLSETSLRLVSKVISDRNDKDLAVNVKSLAQQQGVEPWLRDFLDKQGLFCQDRARRCVTTCAPDSCSRARRERRRLSGSSE